jgi:hypothetical protein
VRSNIVKTITIAGWVLRLGVLLALILGIFFWVGSAADALIPVHMLIGIIVVLSLWVIGLAQGFNKGGSFSVAVVTFVVGLALAIVGFFQQQWLQRLPDSTHWIIQVIHLLLGITAIGLGEMIVAGTKRRLKTPAAA